MTSPDRIVAPRRSRLRIGLGAAVVLVLAALAVAVLVASVGAGGSTTTIAPGAARGNAGADVGGTSGGAASGGSRAGVGAPTPGALPGDAAAGIIYVHLLGAVARPGLYQVRQGDRGVDAIAAAGGFAEAADRGQLNLARLLTDGEQIYVPVVGEVPAIAPGAAGSVPGKVNLNTADVSSLDTLPGIGPSTAKRILDWRTANGRFTSIEDLLSISGIGDKTFAELKDLVTV